jgi:hypothetical protein
VRRLLVLGMLCATVALGALSPTTLVVWAHASTFAYIPRTDYHWLSPKEFRAARGGLCRDFATYTVFELHARNVEAEVLVVRLRDGTLHALVLAEGAIFDPRTPGRFVASNDLRIEYRFSYWQLVQALGLTRKSDF